MSNVPATDGETKKSGGRSCLTVIALFFGYLLLSAILLILPTGFIGPVFAIGGLFLVGVIGFHYVVWGRMLTRILQEKDATDGTQPGIAGTKEPSD
jgi:hypothetical protein